MTGSERKPDTGRFAYQGLDRVMHEKARLGILASLAVHQQGLSFNDLKEACSLTNGNLSRHLTILAEANLVKARKRGDGARQYTKYSLSANGRRRFTAYVELLGQIVSEAKPAPQPGRRGGNPSPGLSQA